MHHAFVLIRRHFAGAPLTKLSGLFGMPSGFCAFLSDKRGGRGRFAPDVGIFSVFSFAASDFAAIPRGIYIGIGEERSK